MCWCINCQRAAMGIPPFKKDDMERDEFEYTVLDIDAETPVAVLEARLTAFGICGWQLVHVQGDRYFLERPR